MKHGICWLFHRCQTIFFDTHIHPPFFCKDIDYLRDKYDSNHNNSKFDNSTSAKPTIQNSTLKIQHCAQRNHSCSGKRQSRPFKTQNSTFNIAHSATILALASGKADYNTQHSTLRIAHNSTLPPATIQHRQSRQFKTQNSTLKTQNSTLPKATTQHSKLNIAEGIASGLVSLHRPKPIQSYLLNHFLYWFIL